MLVRMKYLRVPVSVILIAVSLAGCTSRSSVPVRIQRASATKNATAFLEAHGDIRKWDIASSTAERACEIDCEWVVFVPRRDGAGETWIAVLKDGSCRQIDPREDAASATPWIAYDPKMLSDQWGMPVVDQAK